MRYGLVTVLCFVSSVVHAGFEADQSCLLQGQEQLFKMVITNANQPEDIAPANVLSRFYSEDHRLQLIVRRVNYEVGGLEFEIPAVEVSIARVPNEADLPPNVFAELYKIASFGLYGSFDPGEKGSVWLKSLNLVDPLRSNGTGGEVGWPLEVSREFAASLEHFLCRLGFGQIHSSGAATYSTAMAYFRTLGVEPSEQAQETISMLEEAYNLYRNAFGPQGSRKSFSQHLGRSYDDLSTDIYSPQDHQVWKAWRQGGELPSDFRVFDNRAGQPAIATYSVGDEKRLLVFDTTTSEYKLTSWQTLNWAGRMVMTRYISAACE